MKIVKRNLPGIHFFHIFLLPESPSCTRRNSLLYLTGLLNSQRHDCTRHPHPAPIHPPHPQSGPQQPLHASSPDSAITSCFNLNPILALLSLTLSSHLMTMMMMMMTPMMRKKTTMIAPRTIPSSSSSPRSRDLLFLSIRLIRFTFNCSSTFMSIVFVDTSSGLCYIFQISKNLKTFL